MRSRITLHVSLCFVRHPSSFLAVSVVLSLVLAGLIGPFPARAQTGDGTALITAVDTDKFPAINAYVMVNGPAGDRIAGLPAEASALAESGAAVAGLEVAEQDVGVQVVFVLDTTEAFTARDANAVTRLEYVQQALADFARTTPWMKEGVDDVTVLAAEGLLVKHSSRGGEVAQAVADYASTFAGVADPFPLINQALDYVSEVTPRPGMRRYLVFISNGLRWSGGATPLDDAAGRAAAVQVPIYTMFVGPAGGENTVGAQNLRRLSELTGAAHFIFESPQSFTPLFQRLANQGRQYRLSYRSGLSATGQHGLSVSVTVPTGVELASGEVLFPLRVETPVVQLGDVPPDVVRVSPGRGADPALAEPAALAVPIVVDFPDGHPRSLRAAQLIVDGQVVASGAQAEAAMEALTWPLAGYAESGTHIVQARITDELGLTAESGALTVTVRLEIQAAPAATGPAVPGATGARGLPLVVGAVFGLLLLGAAGWLWYARRARVGSPPAAPPGETPAKPAPGTEPFRPARVQPPRLAVPRVPMPALHLPRRSDGNKPLGPAYLEVVESGGGGAPREAIELLADTVRLGRDAAVAEFVFHERSVSRLHARINRAADGIFRVFDEGSTSGTWVNFTQVPAEDGWELRDGDLINLGRVQLRFRRRDVPAAEASNGAKVVKVTPAGEPAPAPPAAAPAGTAEGETGATRPHRPVQD